MTIISAPHSFAEENLYVDLQPIFGQSLFLKCEAFNFAGSVKLKAANAMVEGAEKEGILKPGSALVESSSGNLGLALSMISANKGYDFVCVTDSRCNRSIMRYMQALGARVHIITHAAPDSDGGLLGARIGYVRALCASDKRYVWLNQYANPRNWNAHFSHDGAGDHQRLPTTRCAVHRRRDHRDSDGLCPLSAGVAPTGACRRC